MQQSLKRKFTCSHYAGSPYLKNMIFRDDRLWTNQSSFVHSIGLPPLSKLNFDIDLVMTIVDMRCEEVGELCMIHASGGCLES